MTLPEFHVQQKSINFCVHRGNMSEETVPRRQYPEEFSMEVIRLVDSVGGHEAAQRLGIPIATLINWLRRRRKAPGKETTESTPGGQARRSPTDLEAENSRLREELASARLDVEILRKATVYFAKGSR